jgi:CBS domain containing-hemolysin-like protein
MVLMCLVSAALASGLTQGLLSLDLMEMNIKARSGTKDEKKFAKLIIPVISRHHLLLVTLMLWNAAANEALPIFLQRLVPEWLSIVLSVTMVLFVGEIIPAAVLTGPNQLMIAAKLLPLVYVVLALFFPIAYPIALVLDMWLGHDEGVTMYNRKEIATMMSIQHEEGQKRGRNRKDSVQLEEVTIVGGALKFSDMHVRDAMTPVDKVFMLSANERLNFKVSYC